MHAKLADPGYMVFENFFSEADVKAITDPLRGLSRKSSNPDNLEINDFRPQKTYLYVMIKNDLTARLVSDTYSFLEKETQVSWKKYSLNSKGELDINIYGTGDYREEHRDCGSDFSSKMFVALFGFSKQGVDYYGGDFGYGDYLLAIPYLGMVVINDSKEKHFVRKVTGEGAIRIVPGIRADLAGKDRDNYD